MVCRPRKKPALSASSAGASTHLAGSLERSGFFLRQAVRRSERPEWQKYNHVTVTIGWSLLAMFYGGVALFVVLTLLHSAVGVP